MEWCFVQANSAPLFLVVLREVSASPRPFVHEPICVTFGLFGSSVLANDVEIESDLETCVADCENPKEEEKNEEETEEDTEKPKGRKSAAASGRKGKSAGKSGSGKKGKSTGGASNVVEEETGGWSLRGRQR